MYCYSNHGDSARAVDDGYVPVEGEALIDHYPATEEELQIAFPERAAIKETERIAALSAAHRKERDRQLVEIFDAGTSMVQRALRLNLYPSLQLNAKQAELDAYAELLRAIPSQPGFPDSVIWPTIPTKELDLE